MNTVYALGSQSVKSSLTNVTDTMPLTYQAPDLLCGYEKEGVLASGTNTTNPPPLSPLQAAVPINRININIYTTEK